MYNFPQFWGDGCKWGVADWYQDFEEEMSKAVESGEPFDTGWISSRKEPESFRIIRFATGALQVNVAESIDELEELVYDALWDVFKSEQEITADDMNTICDALWIGGVETEEAEAFCHLYFESGASTEDKIQKLKDTLGELIEITHEEVDWNYRTCKEMVEHFFTENYGWTAKN